MTTVRVANEFKNEAQENLEKILKENKCLRDKLISANIEIPESFIIADQNLQSLNKEMEKTPTKPSESQSPVMSPVDSLSLLLQLRTCQQQVAKYGENSKESESFPACVILKFNSLN